VAGVTDAPIRVLLVDDDPLVRSGLRLMLDGSDRVRVVGEAGDGSEVLVLTTFDADDQVLRALRAGAGGFLVKDTPPGEIVRAIELVANGDGMLSPAVTRRLIAHVAGGSDAHARRDAARAALETLSGREHEVALAVGEGKSNAEIAAELFMSVATVKAHVSRLLAKLDVDNRVQIALLVQDADGL
jgi:DNA-binding NarL/FixJ family response regulator